jgi:hypothetical protein
VRGSCVRPRKCLGSPTTLKRRTKQVYLRSPLRVTRLRKKMPPTEVARILPVLA